MTSYRLPFSNLFCVKYDNSDIKGKFYDFLTYTATDYDILIQSYKATQIGKYYPANYDTSYITPITASYQFGSEIQIKTSPFMVKYNRFLLPSPGPFGECQKIMPVKFMNNVEERSCGLKFVIT